MVTQLAIQLHLITLYGSGVVIKGTGLLMNNEMDDFSAALINPIILNCLAMKQIKLNHEKAFSSMTPTIVFKDDKPILLPVLKVDQE